MLFYIDVPRVVVVLFTDILGGDRIIRHEPKNLLKCASTNQNMNLLIWETTLHYIKTIYSGLSKSNFKDHYGDATKEQNASVFLPARGDVNTSRRY